MAVHGNASRAMIVFAEVDILEEGAAGETKRSKLCLKCCMKHATTREINKSQTKTMLYCFGDKILRYDATKVFCVRGQAFFYKKRLLQSMNESTKLKNIMTPKMGRSVVSIEELPIRTQTKKTSELDKVVDDSEGNEMGTSIAGTGDRQDKMENQSEGMVKDTDDKNDDSAGESTEDSYDYESSISHQTSKGDEDNSCSINLDIDESKLKFEQLGTIFSAFFQDDRGLNVVDAIVQNSKVQNRLAKSVDRLITIFEKNAATCGKDKI